LLQPGVCLNGGTCMSTSVTGSYNCSCLIGYSGVNCSDVNRCLLQPGVCLNGGTCMSTSVTGSYNSKHRILSNFPFGQICQI
jgi:hypothetical protein